MPSGWSSTTLATGGSSTVSGGALTVNGALAGTNVHLQPGPFPGVRGHLHDRRQPVGRLRGGLRDTQWAAFGTNTGNALYARSRAGTSATDTTITGITHRVPPPVPHRLELDQHRLLGRRRRAGHPHHVHLLVVAATGDLRLGHDRRGVVVD